MQLCENVYPALLNCKILMQCTGNKSNMFLLQTTYSHQNHIICKDIQWMILKSYRIVFLNDEEVVECLIY